MSIHSTDKCQNLILSVRGLFKSLNITAWPHVFLETIIIFRSGATSGAEMTLFTFKIEERKEDPRGREYKVRSCFIVVILRTSFCSYGANPLISLLCTHVT